MATAPARPNQSGEATAGLAGQPAFWSPASQRVLDQQCPAQALQLGGRQRVWRGMGAPDPGATAKRKHDTQRLPSDCPSEHVSEHLQTSHLRSLRKARAREGSPTHRSTPRSFTCPVRR